MNEQIERDEGTLRDPDELRRAIDEKRREILAFFGIEWELEERGGDRHDPD